MTFMENKSLWQLRSVSNKHLNMLIGFGCHRLEGPSDRVIWRHVPEPGRTRGVSRCIHHMLQDSGTDSLHPSAKVPRHVSSWRTTEANSRRFSQMPERSNVNEQMGQDCQSDCDESLWAWLIGREKMPSAARSPPELRPLVAKREKKGG